MEAAKGLRGFSETHCYLPVLQQMHLSTQWHSTVRIMFMRLCQLYCIPPEIVEGVFCSARQFLFILEVFLFLHY